MFKLKNRLCILLTTYFLFPFILISQLTPQVLFSLNIVNEQNLNALETRIQNDLLKINTPRHPWVLHSTEMENLEILDVAIIGGGVAGMTVSFALMKEGISNIQIFDENPKDQEGPWISYARMNGLRSNKYNMGPALGVPSLTFWSWYEEQYGKEAWEKLLTIPTKLWHDYLCWYRQILKLPVKNDMTLIGLNPRNKLLELTFNHSDHTEVVYARKVILATGRVGSGDYEIPNFIKGIDKRFYSHTHEKIDPKLFKNKKIAIIGAGSSAFDAAAVALENGAESVAMIVRRSRISQINKTSPFTCLGLDNGFYFFPDETRCHFMAEIFKTGGLDPSKAAVERIKDFRNLHIYYNTQVKHIDQQADVITLQTNRGAYQIDYLIAATGYDVDLTKRPELVAIIPYILLWESLVPPELLEQFPILGRFPYLGSNFEFLETEAGIAPFLKNIYCFNYGSLLSHGLLSSDIPGISLGAPRLAKGIVQDFLLSDSMLYFEKIRDWETPDFNSSDYPPLLGK